MRTGMIALAAGAAVLGVAFQLSSASAAECIVDHAKLADALKASAANPKKLPNPGSNAPNQASH